MFKMTIDESDADKKSEVFERLMDGLHKGHTAVEVRLGDGLKLSGKLVKVSTPGELGKVLDEKNDMRGLTCTAKREEVFTALEAINSQNFDTPGAFWAKRFGDPDLLSKSKTVALQKFRDFILDEEHEYTDVDFHNFHAADWLLAKTCTDPSTSFMIRDAMNEKAARMLSNEIGYEEENGLSIEEQIKDDSKRLARILRYDDNNRLKVMNLYATSFLDKVSNASSYVKNCLQKRNELKDTIKQIDTNDNARNAAEMGVYTTAVSQFLLSMGKDASCPHPALDSRNCTPDGKVVLKPLIACEYETGRPFAGFAQFVMQRQMAMTPMCKPSNNGAVYFVAKKGLSEDAIVNPSTAVEVPILRRHQNEQHKDVYAADSRTYLPEDAVKDDSKGHKVVYVESSIKKHRRDTAAENFSFSSAINGDIEVKKDTSGNLAFSPEVTKYFASYFAAARANVPFVTTKETQKKIVSYMFNKDVMTQLMRNHEILHDAMRRSYNMSSALLELKGSELTVRRKEPSKVHSAGVEM